MKKSVITADKNYFKVDFDTSNKIMFLRFYGVIDLKDMIDSLSTGIRHQEFEYNMSACCDFSQATVDVDISATEVIFHFLMGLKDKRGDEYHLALVYSDEITKALMDFYRLAFSRSKIDVELFKSIELATDWLISSQNECSVTDLPCSK
jgi:hypothetical protein